MQLPLNVIEAIEAACSLVDGTVYPEELLALVYRRPLEECREAYVRKRLALPAKPMTLERAARIVTISEELLAA